MKIIIAGGRNFQPRIKHSQWLQEKLLDLKCTQVISGCASGADKFGEDIANKLQIPILKFPADWSLGKKAGPLRNEEMAKVADACILFEGGRGTADMKQRAVNHNLIVLEYEEI